MKFAEAKKEMAAEQERRQFRATPPGTFCFVPSSPAQLVEYNAETVSLAMGVCPACGEEVTAEIDRGKVFYQCANYYHFYVRDAMQ